VKDKFGHPESNQCPINLIRKGNVALKRLSHESFGFLLTHE
jgi:hypothetical protein